MEVRSLRVLIIEDDPVIGMLLAEMMNELGHEVCSVATTDLAAVADALRLHPDLMIVDAMLGERSGVAAVREILKSGHVPHLFISGARVQTDSDDAVVLRKPFSESELVIAMDRALALEPVGVSSHV